MKTYIELEQMGIVGTYKHEGALYIIVKGGHIWVYFPGEKIFRFKQTL